MTVSEFIGDPASPLALAILHEYDSLSNVLPAEAKHLMAAARSISRIHDAASALKKSRFLGGVVEVAQILEGIRAAAVAAPNAYHKLDDAAKHEGTFAKELKSHIESMQAKVDEGTSLNENFHAEFK
eukprot:6755435-Pyramimonas_sp.AAC.1